MTPNPPRSTVDAGPEEPHKIRIPAVGGTYHTNRPEILAQRGSQRAARRSQPSMVANPHLVPTDPGKAATLPLKALYRIHEAMVLLSMSRTVIYEQIRAGRLRTVHQGRSHLVPASAITEYVSLLEAEAA
jgi:excisionase family DNA binding protein